MGIGGYGLVISSKVKSRAPLRPALVSVVVVVVVGAVRWGSTQLSVPKGKLPRDLDNWGGDLHTANAGMSLVRVLTRKGHDWLFLQIKMESQPRLVC